MANHNDKDILLIAKSTEEQAAASSPFKTTDFSQFRALLSKRAYSLEIKKSVLIALVIRDLKSRAKAPHDETEPVKELVEYSQSAPELGHFGSFPADVLAAYFDYRNSTTKPINQNYFEANKYTHAAAFAMMEKMGDRLDQHLLQAFRPIAFGYH